MEKSVAEKIFDNIYKSYDSFLKLVTFNRIDIWQRDVIDNTPIGKFVVDVGTGTGEVLKKIAIKRKDVQLIGLDLSLNMLKIAKVKLEKLGVKSLVIKSNAINMPFKDGSIDNLFFSLTFRHLPSGEVIHEIRRVLKNGGYISIVDIAKPDSNLIYFAIYHFTDKIFRPFGRILFSKQEWDYFVESVKNSMTTSQMIDFFKASGFKKLYYKKRFFGLVHICVFQKEDK